MDNHETHIKITDSFWTPIKRILTGIWRFYIDGFRNMTVGRALWALIIIKVAVLFLVFKLLFFPDVLKRDYPDDASRAQAVRSSLTHSEKR